MEKRTVGSVKSAPGSAKSAICDELSCLLEGQLKACDEMITLSRREQQVLMDNQASALPEVVAAKERCAGDLAALEEALRETLTAWEAGAEPGLDKKAPPPLSTLLPYLPVEDRLRLKVLQQSLWSKVHTLRMLSRAIALLIKSSLLEAEAWLSVLSDTNGGNPAYDASGQVNVGNIPGSQLLDHQA